MMAGRRVGALGGGAAALLALTLGLAILSGLAVELTAQRRPTSVSRQAIEHSRDHASVREVFAPVVAPVRDAVVSVYRDGKQVALGTIVDAAGLVVTKASELEAGPGAEPTPAAEGGPAAEPQAATRATSIEVVVHAGGSEVRHAAEQIAVDVDNDLALLRIPVAGLTPVRLAGDNDARVGSFLASAGSTAVPLAIGVMSVARHPRRLTPFLGVRSEAGEAGLRLVEVVEGSAAATAGLQIGDLIVRFAGEPVSDHAVLVAAIAARAAGEQVDVELRRNGQVVRLAVELGRRSDRRGPVSQQERGRLWGPLSRVRLGFTEVIQHDSVLRPEECGGPLLDLDGAVIGINIARVGRFETLAVTARVVADFLDGIDGLPRERRRTTR